MHEQAWVNSLSTIVKHGRSAFPKVHPSQTQQCKHNEIIGQLMQKEENLLLAEIEFWRYMIKSRRGTISEQATERMLHACQLAERKLMMVDSDSSVNDLKHYTA